MVTIKRTGDDPHCYRVGQEFLQLKQRVGFKHNKESIWGIVEAESAEDAMQKLIDYAYENDLWYGIGGKKG
jgi:hypothetical protein